MKDPGEPALPEFVREALDGEPDEAHARSLADALAALARLLPEAPASPAGRERLLRAVADPARRYLPFLERLARFFDLAPARAREILEAVAQPAAWTLGPLPGIELMHLQGGPSLAGVDVGLVRMAPGLKFPLHSHSARERVFVLQGGYRDDSGKLWGPGEIHEMGAGTAHSYEVSGEGLLFALVLYGDIIGDGLGGLKNG